MSFESIRRFTRCTLLLCAVYVGAADAALFTVGNAPVGPNLPQGDFTCQYDKIQDAVNAAQATPRSPGEVHVIRVSYTGTYTQQQVQIGSIDLEISGGYHDCWASQQGWYEPQRETTVSGAGGGPAPVFRVRGSGVRIFRSLFITRGDNLAGDGGGIDYQGIGAVMITDSTIGANQASHGGGIYARASGGEALVEIGANVMIANNLAVRGGAVHLAGQTRLEMLQDKSTLYLNRATVEGGGLWVAGPAHALIGSPGYNGIAAIEGNRAPDGGGIAVFSKGEEPDNHKHVDLVSVDPARPVRITNNEASARGGALYSRSNGAFLGGNGRRVTVRMIDFVLDGNVAPRGAAIYLDDDDPAGADPEGSDLYLGSRAGTPSLCSYPDRCNRVERNRATASEGGAVVQIDADSRLIGNGVTFVSNEGTHLMEATGDGFLSSGPYLTNCVVHGNHTTSDLLVARSYDNHMNLSRCTIADNVVGGAILRAAGAEAELSLESSLIDASGNLIIDHADGPDSERLETRNNILSSLIGASSGDTTSIAAPARFVDPRYGDFRLRPGSPAIDRLSVLQGAVDRDGLPRGLDYSLKPNAPGNGDVGAYEFVPNLDVATNGHFSFDLRAWQVTDSANAVLDAYDLDATYGAPGKNSVRIQAPPGHAGAIAPVRQCIHLPSWGYYRIAASAVSRSVLSDFEDEPSIEWSYIAGADESCGGIPAASGSMGFTPEAGTDLLVWRESQPLVVKVPQPGELAGWTPNAAITLTLKVTGHPDQESARHNLYALFDGIAVTHSSVPPTLPALLKDGFEN